MGTVPDRRVRRVGPSRRRHRSSSRRSTPRWRRGWASPPRCASSPRPAAMPWRWSTTATCTPATTSSSRTTCSATSPPPTWWSCSPRRKQRAFGDAKRDTLPRYCRECEVRFACNGECPKNRFTLTPDGEPGLNYLCAGYKAFFTHIDGVMGLMADRLRSGGFADEVMDLLASAGRNEPCPCGSGRKAKQCHQRPGEERPPAVTRA